MKSYQVTDYRLQRLEGFKDYYQKMMLAGDCDPAYPILNYVCDRMELNIEQRYWLAFLYGCTYCVPTVFYIYNEFPDYENVDVGRLQQWWDKNKKRLVFQTDRMKVKNFDLFVKIFESYRKLMGKSQQQQFELLKMSSDQSPGHLYDMAYTMTSKIYYFGRFSLFNYLEAVHELTEFPMLPTGLDLEEAESCRNGLCYALGEDDMVTEHHKPSKKPIDYDKLHTMLQVLKQDLEQENPEIDVTYWNIETVLCAYKKLHWQDRYLGYYIDRQQEEISKMQANVPEGVDWSVLWDFRKEFFHPHWVGELAFDPWSGIRKQRMPMFMQMGKLLRDSESFKSEPYCRKVKFETIGDVYADKTI